MLDFLDQPGHLRSRMLTVTVELPADFIALPEGEDVGGLVGGSDPLVEGERSDQGPGPAGEGGRAIGRAVVDDHDVGAGAPLLNPAP